MGGEMFCLLSTICEHNPSHPQICAVPAWLALNRAVAALIAFLALSAHCGCAPPSHLLLLSLWRKHLMLCASVC